MLTRLLFSEERDEDKPNFEQSKQDTTENEVLRDKFSRLEPFATSRDQSLQQTSSSNTPYKPKKIPEARKTCYSQNIKRCSNSQNVKMSGRNKVASIYSAQPDGNEMAWSAWC